MPTETVVPVSLVALIALIAQWYTPDVGNSFAVLLTALLSGLAVLYSARTARLVALKEIARVVAPVQAQIAAIEPVVHSVKEQIKAIEPVVARIDTHVNGEKTKNTNELAMRDQKIELQLQTIATMERSAALLAQALAAREASNAVAQAAIAGATAPVASSLP